MKPKSIVKPIELMLFKFLKSPTIKPEYMHYIVFKVIKTTSMWQQNSTLSKHCVVFILKDPN